MHKSSTTDLKLRERVKELRCLYALSRFMLEAGNDVDAMLRQSIRLLPEAMQFPELAEASITWGKDTFATRRFGEGRVHITASIAAGGRSRHSGTLTVAYRPGRGGKVKSPAFLREEKSLLRVVARELSLFLTKAGTAENNRKLELQLQHSKRLAFVGELSAGIAHELNEPLGRILGFAQLIKKNAALTGQSADDIERIIKASLYTREIIKKLMLFSRQMPRQVITVDLNAIIANILYFIDVRFQDRGVMLVRKLEPQLPPVQADPVQMSQVLVNLITNAIHAMPRGGQITVATKSRSDSVRLSVSDTGHGMTPEVKRKIFEPFYTTKPVGQGTGLGLSVVQGIVEEHKGKIVVSSSPGKGARFDVVLPTKQRGG